MLHDPMTLIVSLSVVCFAIVIRINYLAGRIKQLEKEINKDA